MTPPTIERVTAGGYQAQGHARCDPGCTPDNDPSCGPNSCNPDENCSPCNPDISCKPSSCNPDENCNPCNPDPCSPGDCGPLS